MVHLFSLTMAISAEKLIPAPGKRVYSLSEVDKYEQVLLPLVLGCICMVVIIFALNQTGWLWGWDRRETGMMITDVGLQS